MYQLGLQIRLVQQLRQGVDFSLLPPLRKQVLLMAHEEQEDCSLQPPDPANRLHWLSLAGYIAGADGLSDDEALEIAHGATSPDLSKEEAHALLASAAASPLSDEACAAVSTDDLAHRVNCLLELAQAIAIDGMSAAEWIRYCEVAGRVLGAQRVDALLRLTLAEREARRCRTELMFEEYED
jgi:hypothetical protein